MGFDEVVDVLIDDEDIVLFLLGNLRETSALAGIDVDQSWSFSKAVTEAGNLPIRRILRRRVSSILRRAFDAVLSEISDLSSSPINADDVPKLEHFSQLLSLIVSLQEEVSRG